MICTRANCEREATQAPMVCVPAWPRGSGREISAVLGLVVCDDCFGALQASDFLAAGDPGRDTLRAAFAMQAAGRFLPDLDAARLESVPVASALAAAAMARPGTLFR